jgi:hypothetical protein
MSYVPPPSPESGPTAQLLRIIEAEMMVEGNGFVYLHALSIQDFVVVTLQNAAN